ncbi:MAG: Rpn family recombination-promoting nuclease/putative transposase [Aphanizomenon gracile PMC649.10]|nr:Rpn family recombination-promoting nuclease/putative transposase [Aphanizomenon gracile PMC649.10]MDM3853465.1 Rpn family recombination-promoting nuclease/putative transposase [Aphanizomenon gracile PMC649.10]
MAAKYFNPYTDFGFKKLFGEEGSKDLLIDFLNQLLPIHHQIQHLTFKNSENLADTIAERKAIFDIYCESKTGDKFIVEMQKAKIKYFKDRALFYSTFPIREQSEKGDWNFFLLPVYFIAILDFEYDENTTSKFRRDVCLKDQDGDIFFDKLNFKFLQMPLFNKQENELITHFDKWLYFLKNLESFNHIPAILNEPIFQKGFEIAEISHLNVEQYEQYKKSLVQYLEVKNVFDTAFEEGEKVGIEKGIEKVAKALKEQNIAIEIIAQSTGLSQEAIKRI